MKVLIEGGASDPVTKVWFALQLQQGFIILGVKLFWTKQNGGCEFSCVRCFVTFELKGVEVFVVESFHLGEHSIKSV